MVEGKLRKTSQIDPDLMADLYDLLPDGMFRYEDDFHYFASPAEEWDTNGDTYVGVVPEGVAQLDTTNVPGNEAFIAKDANSVNIESTKPFKSKFRIEGMTVTDNYAFLGFVDARPTAAAPPVEPNNAAYFRVINVAGAAHWFAVVIDAATPTEVDTGVVAVTSPMVFRIESDATNYKFYIDNVLKATIPVQVALTFLFPVMSIITQAVAAKTMLIDLFRLTGTRSV